MVIHVRKNFVRQKNFSHAVASFCGYLHCGNWQKTIGLLNPVYQISVAIVQMAPLCSNVAEKIQVIKDLSC